MVADGKKPGFSGYGAEREATTTAAAAGAEPGSAPDAVPGAALAELIERFSEVREYLLFYLRTRVDAIRVSIRNLLLLSVIVVGAMASVGALAITAVVFLTMGIAQGLTALLGGHAWLGNIVTAVLMLGAIGGATYLAVIRITKTSKQRMVDAYEGRKRRQRHDHGTDVEQRAEETRV
jgi:hypothetical protein